MRLSFLILINLIVQSILVFIGMDIRVAIFSMISISGLFIVLKLEDIHEQIKTNYNIKQ